MKKYHTVYCTTNLLNGRFYIGKHSTNKVDDYYLGSGHKLLRAIKKYGRENFKKEILCVCDDEDGAYEMERRYVGLFCDGNKKSYNIADGGLRYGENGNCNLRGRKHTKKERSKISKAVKGRRHSEESKKKMSEDKLGEKNPNYGKSPSKETRLKLSIAGSLRRASDETKAKMSIAMKGRIITKEARCKISEARKKKVDQYTVDGVFICTHNSINDAAMHVSKNTSSAASNISMVLNGKGNTACGYIWKFTQQDKLETTQHNKLN